MGNWKWETEMGNGKWETEKWETEKIGNKLPIKGTRNPLGAQSVASLDASNSPDGWRGWNGAGQGEGRRRAGGRAGEGHRVGQGKAGLGLGQDKPYLIREHCKLSFKIFSHQKKAKRPIKQGYRGLFLGPALLAGRENALWLNSMPDRAWSLTQGIFCPAGKAWSNYWPLWPCFLRAWPFY